MAFVSQENEQRKLAATVKLQALMKEHFIDAARRDREEERMANADRGGTNILHVHHHEPVPSSLAEKRIPPHNALYDREASKVYC